MEPQESPELTLESRPLTETAETAELPASEIESPDDEPLSAVTRRIWKTSIGAYLVFAIGVTTAFGWRALLGLTCSAAVVMINFLWLEEIVSTVLQPAPRLHAWRFTLRAMARFALLGAALLVTILVARFNAVSVLLGFSIVVVGIFGEAVYSLRRSLSR